MPSIQIRAPLGYQRVVALNRTAHATLGLPEPTYGWCARLNAIHLSVGEFASAAASYPIVFTRDEDSGEFSPVAVLGLRNGENLFVEPSGQWLPRAYLPAHVRCYPFCVAEIETPGGGAPQRLVCVEDGALQADGAALFSAGGQPTALWEKAQRLLESVEASRLQTRVLCKRLESLGLFTPFDALAMPRAGRRTRLQGMFRVDEEKMNAIPGKDLRVMLRKGELKATYAHLVSLENFAALMELAAGRDSTA